MSTQTETAIVKDYVNAGGLGRTTKPRAPGTPSSCCTAASLR